MDRKFDRFKIKKGDKVHIITGKNAGKEGKVLRIRPKKNFVYVEGVNMVKRHTKQKSQTQPAAIIEKEGPMDISNVMIICASCNKPTRVRYKMLDDGEKVRLCKKCDNVIA